ncbi:MAG: peptidylprolyl isomerase [Planctomycetota bacterium]|nr:peptidylprolyl isomerase [Planctomycetota bacterium]
MNKLILKTTLLASISLVSVVTAQEQPATDLATVNGEKISVERYRDFLFTTIGSSELARLVDTVLIEQAAKAFDIVIDADVLAQRVDVMWRDLFAPGSEEEFLNAYLPQGFNKEMAFASLRASALTRLQLENYIVATRIITDQKLQKSFVAKYGHNGIKTEVAHIMIIPHNIRAEALAANEVISFERAKQIAAEKSKECLQKLSAGAQFSEMVTEYSHDNSSKLNNGVLATYRPGIYGEAFKNEVEGLAVAQTSQTAAESGAGYHIIRVNSRVVTQLSDVRTMLTKHLLEAPADIGEIKQTIIDLRAAAKIEY